MKKDETIADILAKAKHLKFCDRTTYIEPLSAEYWEELVAKQRTSNEVLTAYENPTKSKEIS
jgi:hypothetical protein